MRYVAWGDELVLGAAPTLPSPDGKNGQQGRVREGSSILLEIYSRAVLATRHTTTQPRAWRGAERPLLRTALARGGGRGGAGPQAHLTPHPGTRSIYPTPRTVRT